MRAGWGKIGTSPSHCMQHRLSGMIRRSNSKCITSRCKSAAIYGNTFAPYHCEIHRTEDEMNLIEQPCHSCGLMMILDVNNHCEACDPSRFQRARLKKQNELMAYLDTHGFPGISTDKIIDDGICGRERPDRVYDYGDKIIILEWNPDEYEPLDDSFKEEEILRRYKLLVATLKDIQNGKMKLPNALTSALYLYYDGWNGIHEAKWEIVTEMHNEVSA